MGAFAAVRFSSRQELPENRRPHSIARQNSPGADLADYCDIGIVSLKRTAWPSFNGTYGADGQRSTFGVGPAVNAAMTLGALVAAQYSTRLFT
jgi:hypothetical protein